MNKKGKKKHLDNDQKMSGAEATPENQNDVQEEINDSDNVTEGSENEPISTQEPEKDEIAELKEKNMQLHDTYLRLNAEFDNFRKRTLRDRAELLKTATEKVITEILPVIDNLERALGTLETELKDEVSDKHVAIIEGIKLIHADILRVLSNNNVKEIEALGEKFNGDIHEAITSIPAAVEEDKDKIVDCIQKGYKLGDKIIRYPKVVVAK